METSSLSVLNHDVLITAFSFLDISSLKAVRLTCQTFADLSCYEFSRQLRCITVLTHPKSFDCLDLLSLHRTYGHAVSEINIVTTGERTPGTQPFRSRDHVLLQERRRSTSAFASVDLYLQEQEDFIREGQLLRRLREVLGRLTRFSTMRVFTCDRRPQPAPLSSRGLPPVLFSQASSGNLSLVIRSILMAIGATTLRHLDLIGPRTTIWDPTSPGLRQEDLLINADIPRIAQEPLIHLTHLRLRLGDIRLDVSRVLAITTRLTRLDLILSPLGEYKLIDKLLASLPQGLESLALGNVQSTSSSLQHVLQRLTRLRRLALCQAALQNRRCWVSLLVVIYGQSSLKGFAAHNLHFKTSKLCFMKYGPDRSFSVDLESVRTQLSVSQWLERYKVDIMKPSHFCDYELELCLRSGLCSCFQEEKSIVRDE